MSQSCSLRSPSSSSSSSSIPSSAPSLLSSLSVSKDKWSAVLEELIDTFIMKLKRREVRGSGSVATQTAELLRTVISRKKFSSVPELLELLRLIGRALTQAHPIELAIGNIVRRVLYIVRHEVAALLKEDHDASQQAASLDLSLSLHKLLDQQNEKEHAGMALDNAQLAKLKPAIIEEIGLLMEEIKNAEIGIAEQAAEHIYAKEVIMTFGISRTVVAFLKEAARFRKFEVVVAESAPSYEGQKMAMLLAETGIETTVITDSAVFALMPSVNKVIIGTHGVMANGGLIAHTGAANIAAAAKHHSVPFVVLSGLHKLSPLYAFDQDTFNEQNAPSQLLKFEDEFMDSVDVENPAYDYITPDLVTLFITNERGHNPTYIYRLLAEYYNPADYKL